MSFSRVSLAGVSIAGAVVAVVACSTSSPNGAQRAATATEPVTVAASNTSSCPAGTQVFCSFSNIDLSEGGPRPSDQCSPAIGFTFNDDVMADGDRTSFTWSSPVGQRTDALVFIDAVVVSGGGASNVYTYDPPVSHDDTPLVAPGGTAGMPPALSHITFCVKPDAGSNADAGGGPMEGPPDAAADDSGGKTW